MSLRLTYTLLAGAIFSLGAAACDHTPTVCTADLRVAWSPQDTAIAVGEHFTASMQLSGCLGTKPLTDTITFVSSNEAVAVVGVSSGVVTGLRPGTATITVSAKHYHVDMPIPVTVR